MTGTGVVVRAEHWLRSGPGLSAGVQQQRRIFPVMQPTVSRNMTAAAHILLARHTLFQPSAANAPGAAWGTEGRP